MKNQVLRMTLLAMTLLPLQAAYALSPGPDTDCGFSTSNDTDAGNLLQNVNEAMQANAIPGAQLVHSRQGVYHAYCHGVMSKASGERVTDRTVFQSASLS